jgi:hypothetical protein
MHLVPAKAVTAFSSNMTMDSHFRGNERGDSTPGQGPTFTMPSSGPVFRGMIPKSGYRFSDEIMRKVKMLDHGSIRLHWITSRS